MEPIDWKTIKEYEDILFDYCDGIAKITINRPQVYNAFRPQTNCEMLDAMSICRERSDIGVIILTGAGDKAFCSGGDQKVKGIGGYIDENGVPRLNGAPSECTRFAQGNPFTSQTCDRYGQRLCYRRRACVACGM